MLTSCNNEIFSSGESEKYILNKIISVENLPGENGIVYSGMNGNVIDRDVVDSLPEYKKAIVALYSSLGGTNCYDLKCDLTMALGLGEQGSDKHKNILKTYFPDDPLVKTIINGQFYISSSSSSNFSEYNYLSIVQKGDTIVVPFELMFYSHGDISTIKNRDIYVFKNNKFTNVNRFKWLE